MGLTSIGVTFVAQGYQDFLSSLSGASAAVANLGNMTKNRLAAINSYNDAIVETTKSMTKMAVGVAAFDAAGAIFGSSADRISSSFRKIGKSAQDAETYIAKFAKVGGWLGGALGGALPLILGQPELAPMTGALGDALGSIIGGMMGVLPTIIQAISKLFGSITSAVTTLLPKTLGVIINAARSIVSGIINFGKSIISAVGNIISSITNAISGLFEGIFGMFGGGSNGGFRSLGDNLFGAMFKFEVLKQIIRKVIFEIKSFAKSAFDAAAEVQTLTIRIENLIATQLREAGATDNYAKSILMAKNYTQELLQWTQELAMATPFSASRIAEVTTLSIAMGWGVDSAKELTGALLNYNAAQGLSNEVLERIIYNFAQMKTQGKVTGTELRDLGRGAFMPVNAILDRMAQNLGVTAGEMENFRDQASKGQVPVEEFFQAFIDYVNEQMPDAARKMNYTFAAVKDNIADLFNTILGWKMLTPVIEELTKPVQDFLANLDMITLRMNASGIGKALAYIVESFRISFGYITSMIEIFIGRIGMVSPTIESVIASMIKFGALIQKIGLWVAILISKYIVPLGDEIHDKFGDEFDAISDDAFTWGANLIISFAKGIIEAASDVLTKAMNWIASILTSWLKGKSPPRILPEIDIWGMETMNEWLHGFTMADFDILDSMKSSIKDSLDALVNLGEMSEETSVSTYSAILFELVDAMDELNRTGTISAGIFSTLASIQGPYGQELAELLELQVQYAKAAEQRAIYEKAVADATRVAEQAQIAYDAAVKATSASRVKTNDLIYQYNAMMRAGADPKTLQDQLKLVNLSEMQLYANMKAEEIAEQERDLADEQLDAAEDALKAFEDSLKPLKEAIALQEELIKQLTDIAKIQNEIANTGRSGAGGGGGGTSEEGFGGGFTIPSGGAGIPELDFEAIKKKALEEFNKLWEQMKKDLAQVWYDSFVSPSSPFQVSLKTLKGVLTPVLNELKKEWNVFAKAIKLPSFEEISSAWGTSDDGQTISQRFMSVISLFVKNTEENGGLMGILGRLGTLVFQGIITKLDEAFNDPANQAAMQTTFNTFMSWLADTLLGTEITMGVAGGGGANAPSPGMERLADAMIETLKSTTQTLIDDITKPGGFIYDNATKIGSSIVSGLVDGIKTKIEEILWDNIWDLIVQKTLSFFGISDAVNGSTMATKWGSAIVKGVSGGMGEEIDSYDWKGNIWRKIVDIVLNYFGIRSPSTLAKTWGKDIILGMVTGMTGEISATNWSADIWGKIVESIKTFVTNASIIGGSLYSLGSDIVGGIISGLESMKTMLRAKIVELINMIPQKVRDLLNMDSPSKVMMAMGRNVVAGLAIGMLNSSGMVENAMNKVMGSGLGVSSGGRLSPSMAAQSMLTNNYSTVNMGGVIINSGLDEAAFESLLYRAIGR